jgi:hypothetical protein
LIRIRAIIVLGAALGAAFLIAACGGGGGNNEDPTQVLRETFTNDKSITSGTFDLDFKVDANGGDNEGNLEAKIGGPFQGQPGKFPQFAMDVSLKAEGGSQSFSGSGGLTSTGTGAFVNFQGTEYSVPQELFDQFTSTYAQLQAQSGSQTQGTGLLASLGINPVNWLTDLSNEGTEDIQGAQTIHISGKADVPRLVEDLKTIAAKAGSAVGNIQPAQLDRLNSSVQSADFDIYTGEQDKILRRIKASIEVKPTAGTPGAPDSVDIDFDLTFADVNKPQTIRAPSGAQPLSNLLNQFGISPSTLGQSLRGSLGAGGALPQSGGSTTPPSNGATQAYLSCIQQAKGQAALQHCANLLR